MTIFSHFETKNGVLKTAIQKYSYVLPMRKLFEEKIKWNLELDLVTVSKAYQDLMKKTKTVLLIAIEERNTKPHFMEQITQNPQQLKEFLIA